MSKLFRILIVGMALLGLAATATACSGESNPDAGDASTG
jgi:hypothetical protein